MYSAIVNYLQQSQQLNNTVENNEDVNTVRGMTSGLAPIPIKAPIVQVLSPPILWNWDVVATGQIPLAQFFFAIQCLKIYQINILHRAPEVFQMDITVF
jgi:hypothetical protein